MKAIEERNFPYPILLDNGGDFIDSSFTADCAASLTEEKKSVILKINYEIKCDFINKLINDGKIAVVVNIEQRTFRQSGLLNSNQEFIIPVSLLSPGFNLEIMPMLVARQDYSFGYDECMDKVFSYFDDDFIVKKYQIVGYGTFNQVEVPQNDKIGSIFTVSKLSGSDINKKVPYIITLENDVINIGLLPEIFDSFTNSIKDNLSYNKILFSTIVYPSIQLAILTILQDYNSVKEKKWCIAITNKITKKKGINFDSLSDNFSKDDISEYTHIVLESLMLDAYNDINGGN